MKIGRLLKVFCLRMYEFVDPAGAAKKRGVNCGKNFDVRGHIKWGSEPWIITIGDNVHLADGTRFVTHDGGPALFRDEIPDLEITKPITIGSNVYIATDATILPGVNIGDNVVIGARSVVSRDIPSNSVAVGIPCRVIKTIEEYKDKLVKESLHLGHLSGKEKDEALKQYYNYKKQ